MSDKDKLWELAQFWVIQERRCGVSLATREDVIKAEKAFEDELFREGS